MSNNAGPTKTKNSIFKKLNPSLAYKCSNLIVIGLGCASLFVGGRAWAQNPGLELPQKKSNGLEKPIEVIPPAPVPLSRKKTTDRSSSKKRALPVFPPADVESTPKIERASSEITEGPAPLNFKVETPLKDSDSRPQFQFNDGILDKTLISQPDFKKEELPDSEVFALYPGYPKNQISVGIRPYSVSSNWNYQGQDFSFPTTSIGYGIGYRFQPTPKVLLEAEYAAYGIETPAGTVSPYAIQASSTSMDSVFIKGAYCFFGSSSFFRQLCPGVDIGYDTYPVLDFSGSSTLKLSRVRDIIFGLNLAYQIPLTDQTRLRLKAGYNRGTGAGNSGTLTSKENASYYLLGELNWDFNDSHSILIGGEYRARDANLSGKRGVITDTWKTTTVILGLQLSYVYTF